MDEQLLQFASELGGRLGFYLVLSVIILKGLTELFKVVGPPLQARAAAAINGGASMAAHNGRGKVDIVKLNQNIDDLANWHKTDGAAVVRLTNAFATNVDQQTSLLKAINDTQQQQAAGQKEIVEALTAVRVSLELLTRRAEDTHRLVENKIFK